MGRGDYESYDGLDSSSDLWRQADLTNGPKRRWYQWFVWYLCWLTVRPLRWISNKLLLAYWYPRYWFEWHDYFDDGPAKALFWPNFFLWPAGRVLSVVGHFLRYSWRWPLATNGPHGLRRTWVSDVAAWIAQLLTWRCVAMSCYHCNSSRGDPVELQDDMTGTTFLLRATWSAGTMDGTDHRFNGTTICPVCGYRSYYEDGSL